MSFDEHTSSDFRKSLYKYQQECLEHERKQEQEQKKRDLERLNEQKLAEDSQQEIVALESRVSELEQELKVVTYRTVSLLDAMVRLTEQFHSLLTKLNPPS